MESREPWRSSGVLEARGICRSLLTNVRTLEEFSAALLPGVGSSLSTHGGQVASEHELPAHAIHTYPVFSWQRACSEINNQVCGQ